MMDDKQLFALVRKIAWSFARRTPWHVTLDDLMGAGGLGLAQALRRRDEMSDDEFVLYASSRIRGAVIDELRRFDPLSRQTRRAAKRLERGVMQTSDGSEVDAAKAVGIRPSILARIHEGRAAANAGPTLSIVPTSREDSPEDLCAAKESLERVKALTKRLSPRMQQVMDAKYGNDESQSDIARKLGLTQARICQLHSIAVHTVATQYALENAVA